MDDTNSLHDDDHPHHHVIPTWNSLPEEMIVVIFTFLDVQTLVEIKPVSHQWKRRSTTVINAKGIGTTRKAFETNKELRNTVIRYCPAPRGGNVVDEDENLTLQYCHRDVAEEIACTYGWPISKWDVSNIEDFTHVFYGQERFVNHTQRQRPGSTRLIRRIRYVNGVSLFNEDISEWNVAGATTMNEMFLNANKFNQDLSAWNVSNVRTMIQMFYKAKQFNQDISSWDVSNVRNMKWMFHSASQFNQDISSWDVSNVTHMESMFRNATLFNQDISSWDVSNVSNMNGMFYKAKQFNQNLSTWDVSNARYMIQMFWGSSSYSPYYRLKGYRPRGGT